MFHDQLVLPGVSGSDDAGLVRGLLLFLLEGCGDDGMHAMYFACEAGVSGSADVGLVRSFSSSSRVLAVVVGASACGWVPSSAVFFYFAFRCGG